MGEIKVTYNGNLKTTATAGRSQITLSTDNSAGSREAGATYTPVDMFVTSLGACMLSMMGAAAARKGIAIEGATVAMSYDTDPDTHRVTAVRAAFDIPAEGLSEADRKVLMGAAKACPVGASFREDIKKELTFGF